LDIGENWLVHNEPSIATWFFVIERITDTALKIADIFIANMVRTKVMEPVGYAV
jgi:hypothetical protein